MKQPPRGEFAKSNQGKTAIPGYDDKLVVPDDRTLQQKGGDLAIYADLLRDDQVGSTFQQRRLALTAKEWIVEPATESAIDKEAADFAREQLQAIGWDDLTDKALYGVFFGYSIAELMWERQGNRLGWSFIKVRDRARFNFGQSGKLYLRKDNGSGWDLMPERKFWTFTAGGDNHDQLYGSGLAQKLYWPVFFKRNDIKFWLIFLERYASPTGVARMPAGQYENDKLRNKVLQSLEAMASEGQIVVPEGTTLDFLESIYSGSADYESMKRTMDAAIAKIVLSQTMTTDDGSSRSQSETHKAVRDEVVQADSDLICDSFNRGPLRWLTEVNFPSANPPRVWRQTEPEEDLNTRAERDGKIYKMGFEPTEEYIEENYGPGWIKRKANPVRIPSIGGQNDAEDDDAAFAELSELVATRNAHRADQQALVDAARKFAREYRERVGEQVGQLLEYLDSSDDLETFQRRLGEILQAPPPSQQVDAIQRGGIVARLMGRVRGS